MGPEYHVQDRIFTAFNEAVEYATQRALCRGESVSIDVVAYSEADAAAYGGEDAAESYREDPDATILERLVITAHSLGRIP